MAQDGKYKPGQIKNGFNVIVHNFEEAKNHRFPTLKGSLIYEARKLSWTESSKKKLPDPSPFRLNITSLAKRYRCDRNGLRDRFDELIVSRVFLPAGSGAFRINKDSVSGSTTRRSSRSSAPRKSRVSLKNADYSNLAGGGLRTTAIGGLRPARSSTSFCLPSERVLTGASSACGNMILRRWMRATSTNRVLLPFASRYCS